MIKNFKILDNGLNIHFVNDKEEIYPNIWLRDHAKDEENWDKRSHQRKTYTASLDLNIEITKAEIIDNGKGISIHWADMDQPIEYSYEFLNNNSLNNIKQKQLYKSWTKSDLSKDLFIDFEKINYEEIFKFMLKQLNEFGFVVLENCETELHTVKKIANKIGYVRNSIFGGLWSFESNENMADSSYTQEELRPHTDATYSNDAPGLQLLMCSEYNAEGGESILVDGYKIADLMKSQNQYYYDILTKIEVTGNYIGDGVFLEAKRPIFKLNSKNELIQVSYNNYDRASFRMKNNLTMDFYKAIKEFDLIANDKKNQWRHILRPGQLLIINNWRLLHGRGSFKGTRKMSGCYINKEDFDSTCKINGIN